MRCSLDPPYSTEADRNETLYREEDLSKWLATSRRMGDQPSGEGATARLRIALCGYEGEHAMPASWSKLEWKTRGGYAKVADGETKGKANCRREVIWFSPHCLGVQQPTLL